jgi:hypothetical protein
MTKEEKITQAFKLYRMQCNELILQIHGYDNNGCNAYNERFMKSMRSGKKPTDVAIDFKLDVNGSHFVRRSDEEVKRSQIKGYTYLVQ